METYTVQQKADILDDLVQACTTHDHKNEVEIVGALKELTESSLDILKNRKIVKALKHNIEKIEKELREINAGVGNVQSLEKHFEGLTQERIEHLCHLKDTLKFILEKPEVEINL